MCFTYASGFFSDMQSAIDILHQVLGSQEMDMSQVPQTHQLTPLSLSDLCAKYLGYQFQSKLNACSCQSIGIAIALHALLLMLLVPLTSELDHVALVLVKAFLNHGKHYEPNFSIIIIMF